MKVIEITKPGGPEVLKVSTRSCPEPESGQVLIKVAFAGVNRPDALQRAGLYKPPRDASDLPGLEAAGEVVKIGKAVSGVSVGDNVCAPSRTSPVLPRSLARPSMMRSSRT
jgi:NADPH2:quinone reductase